MKYNDIGPTVFAQFATQQSRLCFYCGLIRFKLKLFEKKIFKVTIEGK